MFPNPQDALPLPQRPNLEQYKKLAKELARAAKSGDEAAILDWSQRWVEALIRQSGLEINKHLPVDAARWTRQVANYAKKELLEKKGALTLAKVQFVVARAEGFESWPKFAKHIEDLRKSGSAVAQFEEAADAIVTGDVTTLKRLLRANPKLVHTRSTREHGATLLHYVSANGVEGYRQKTPKNIVEITKILLDAGANVNATCDVYGGDCNTLGLTATSVHPENAGVMNDLLEVLLNRGSETDTRLASGKDSLVVNGALANGRLGAAEFLASRGARLDLEGAAGMGRLDLVRSFFANNGNLKLNATKDQMQAGLNWACEYRRPDVVEFLLEHGADPALLHRGTSGLHWAAYGGHSDLMKSLLRRNPPVNKRDTIHGGTPLEWALYGWAEPRSQGRDGFYEVVQLLVDAGATVDPRWLDASDNRPSMQKLRADSRMRTALRLS